MSTEFAFCIGEQSLRAILTSMERVLEAHPELEGKLGVEVRAEIIPDGIGYEIGSASAGITASGHAEPIMTLEQISLEEITQEEVVP